MKGRSATPLVSPLERLTYLHTIAMLSRLAPSELLALAEHFSEMSFGRGALLVAEDRGPDYIHIIVSGRAAMRENGRPIRTLSEHDSIGLLSVLAGRAESLETVALSRVRTLAIESRVFLGLLEDRFSVYHTLLRYLCSLLRSERQQVMSRTAAPRQSEANEAIHPTNLAGRMLLMQRTLPFAFNHPVALSQLAERAELVELVSGDELWRIDDMASGIYLLASGRLTCASMNGQFELSAPSAGGFVDAMSEKQRTYSARAAQETVALRIEREAMLDALEDHAHLAASCLRQLADAAIDVIGKRAAMTGRIPTGLRQTTGEHPVQRGNTLVGLRTAAAAGPRGRDGDGDGKRKASEDSDL